MCELYTDPQARLKAKRPQRKAPSSAVQKKLLSDVGAADTPTQNLRGQKMKSEEKDINETKNERGTTREDTMKTINNNAMSAASEMPLAVESVSEKSPSKPITEVMKETLSSFAGGKTSAIQPVSLDDSGTRLQMAGLDSMSLLQRSGNKLMEMIDDSVNNCRVDAAIHAANALSSTVQVQVNMLKAMNDFRKGSK